MDWIPDGASADALGANRAICRVTKTSSGLGLDTAEVSSPRGLIRCDARELEAGEEDHGQRKL